METSSGSDSGHGGVREREREREAMSGRDRDDDTNRVLRRVNLLETSILYQSEELQRTKAVYLEINNELR